MTQSAWNPWAPPENVVVDKVELIGGEAHGKKVPREFARRLGVIRIPLPVDLSYAFRTIATYTRQFDEFCMEHGIGEATVIQYRYDRRWNRAFYIGEEGEANG